MTDTNRGTGRTSRAITLSLCAMLRGQSVIHISANEQQRKEAMQIAARWLLDNGWQNPPAPSLPVVTTHQDLMKFGKGQLRFMTLQSNLAGLRPALVVEDHYAEEERARLAAVRRRQDALDTIQQLMQEHGLLECYFDKRISGAPFKVIHK